MDFGGMTGGMSRDIIAAMVKKMPHPLQLSVPTNCGLSPTPQLSLRDIIPAGGNKDLIRQHLRMLPPSPKGEGNQRAPLLPSPLGEGGSAKPRRMRSSPAREPFDKREGNQHFPQLPSPLGEGGRRPDEVVPLPSPRH